MTDSANETLSDLLKNSSRSVFLGVMGLRSPQKEYICSAYLLNRFADIFNNASHAPLDSKMLLAKNLRVFMAQLKMDSVSQESALQEFLKIQNETLSDFDNYFAQNPDDHKLYSQSQTLLRNLMSFPLAIRSAFSDSLTDKVLGVEDEISSTLDHRRAKSIREFEQHSETHAGTIGLLLTRIFWDAQAYQNQSTLNTLESLGESYGKALHVANTLKDFHKEWLAGRSLWPNIQPPSGIQTLPPDTSELNASLDLLKNNFDKHEIAAKEFVQQLDPKRNDIRFFCALPLEISRKIIETASLNREWLKTGDLPEISKVDMLLLVQKLTLQYALPKIF